MLEWKFYTAIFFQCLVCGYGYLATRFYLLTACLAMSFLFMSFVYITCIYLGKQEPFMATQTGTADHFWLPKAVRGGPFLAAKIGPGDHFWAGPIFA